jgi:hypothetical protein
MSILSNIIGPDFARGYVVANEQYNQKQLAAKQERYKNMAEMYSHLSQNVADPELANQFSNRAFQFANADPFNPRSAKNLTKLESPSDVFDEYHNRKMMEPHGSQPAPRDEWDVQNFIGPKPPTYDPTGRKVSPDFERYEREQASIEPQVTQMRIRQKVMKDAMSQFSHEGIDPDSPEAEMHQNLLLRAAGINEATPSFQSYPTALLGEDGQRHPVLLQHGLRSGKFYMTTPDGKSVLVHPDLPTPQVKVGPDGNVYPIYGGVSMGAPIGNVGVQTGTQATTVVDPVHNTTSVSRQKTFTHGSVPGVSPGVVGGATPYIPPTHTRHTTVAPISGTVQQPVGTPPKILAGPIDWERMTTEAPSLEDRRLAGYVVHPEAWKGDVKSQAGWAKLWSKYGLNPNGPSDVSKMEGQRQAIVSGLRSVSHIENVLKDTDGQIVGVVAGRWVKAMNELGSASGMKAATNSLFHPNLGNWDSPNVATLAKTAASTPGVDPQQADLIAQKASDLITSLRVFNIQELRSLAGANQGISRIFAMIAPAMADPKMDMPLIEGHLKGLSRNFLDGLRTIEETRWGKNIPYIKEKSDLASLHFYPDIENGINAVVSKTGLSREDAVFELWKKGLLFKGKN